MVAAKDHGDEKKLLIDYMSTYQDYEENSCANAKLE